MPRIDSGRPVVKSGDVQIDGQKADGNHQHGINEGFEHRRPAIGLNHGEHANAGASVVFAIEPGNGHEVGKLPDEENGEQGDGRPLDTSTGGGPTEQGRHGSGEGSNECGHAWCSA